MTMREKCGVFAISGSPMAAELAFMGLYALQHRGQEDAYGIMTRKDVVNEVVDPGNDPAEADPCEIADLRERIFENNEQME